MTPSRTRLGIFARVFPVQPAADLAALIGGLGFGCVQLNLTALGHPTVPSLTVLTSLDLPRIRADFDHAGVAIWGLSGTYNMAHPNPSVRREQTHRAAALIERSAELGVVAVSLCTGTRDPDDQWRGHPGNSSPEAWNDMLASFDVLLPAARSAGVKLAVEPEPANVVSDTDAAVRLLDELGTSGESIGFILDPANLVAERAPHEHDAVLADAFDRLGPRTICVHAKDIVPWSDRLAGTSGLDFANIGRLVGELPSTVPVVIQDTEPRDVAGVRDLLIDALAR